jgi:hypothetical protein
MERMGVTEFLSRVKEELNGQVPDGRRVRVGVTDTGVTFGHPAFQNPETGVSRIEYMKDFTAEGAGFVTPEAKIKVERSITASGRRSSQMIPVTITAEYLEPGFLDDLSSGNEAKLEFSTITDEVFLLPKQLVEVLERPETTVRLGVLQEKAFANDEDQVDINGNGKTDDEFFFFHVPAAGRRVDRLEWDWKFSCKPRLERFQSIGRCSSGCK